MDTFRQEASAFCCPEAKPSLCGELSIHPDIEENRLEPGLIFFFRAAANLCVSVSRS